jgi:hypothetical protein
MELSFGEVCSFFFLTGVGRGSWHSGQIAATVFSFFFSIIDLKLDKSDVDTFKDLFSKLRQSNIDTQSVIGKIKSLVADYGFGGVSIYLIHNL